MDPAFCLTNLEFLKITPGARPTALGEAFVALSDDINSVSFNPAGLGFNFQSEFQATYSLWLAEIKYGFLGYHQPTKIGNFALNSLYLITPKIMRIEEGAIKSNSIKPYALSGNISYGKKIYKNLSLGLTLKSVQEVLDPENNYRTFAFCSDAGVLYRSSNEVLSFGYAAQNVGVGGGAVKLPVIHRLGTAFKFSIPQQYSNINISFEATKQEYSNWSYSIGIEHIGAKILSLRIGYKYYTDKHIRKNLTTSIFQRFDFWRFGIGLNIKGIEIDYAYQPVATVGDTHRISFGAKFGKSQLKTIPAQLKIDPEIFSPNGDGIKDGVFFFPEVPEIKKVKQWSITIRDEKKQTVKTFSGKDTLPVTYWDGKDTAEKFLQEGTYEAELTVKGDGKIAKVEKKISVDLTPPIATLNISTAVISPDNDGIADCVTFYFLITDTNTIERWQLDILTADKKTVKSFSSTATIDGLTGEVQEIVWDGKEQVYNNIVPNGEYSVQLVGFDIAGNRVSTTTSVTVYVPEKVKVIEKIVESDKRTEIIKELSIEEDERGLKAVLSTDMLFQHKKSKLTEAGERKLNRVVEFLSFYTEEKVLIEGHTDSVGERGEKIEFSSKLAWSVYSFLVKNGINPARLSVKGYGPDKPIASNATRHGRAKNRRIEIIILKK
ncbi:MAG: PorV/PorQ family protein [Elusimicrobiota bacterium]|nr:PorV/PorQ family protein [Elusimicrobiota bacterium]